ncbi:MFS transporter [Cupriavidus plantarum]|uniref:MFS transporter n=1 Tax=Cupriavidus plantarum TaxID=942865 RepID=A0A316F0Y5_9BURK|nr:MFS transporter [Cupriavidus plantarum]PWK38584.1 MFS transporter [Cupriavidus plantarum]
MTASPSMPPEIARKISWRLGPLMILMYMANQLDRANIGYAALTMNQELGMTAAQYGLAASLFFIGYVLFEVPSNLCMYRFGARLWMTRIMITWGIVSSLTCLVPNAQWLYVARFVLGVFEAGLFPGMVFYLTLWLPAKDRVWMMSLFVTAIPLTGVFGAPISTWLMAHVTLFGLSGWRAMIFLEGLPSIALGIFVFFYLPDGPAKARWLSPTEKRAVASVLALEQKQSEARATQRHDSVWTTLSNPRVWALGAVYFGVNAGIVSLLFFLPQVVASFEKTLGVKYTITQIGMITAIPFAFAAVSMLVWGRMMQRRQLSSRHVAGPLLVCAAALTTAMWMTSPYAAIAAFAIGAAGCFCTMTTFWQLPTRFLAERAAAAGIAMITSLGVCAGFVLPYFIGWSKDVTGHFAVAFYGVSILMVVSAVIVTALEASRRKAASGLTPAT